MLENTRRPLTSDIGVWPIAAEQLAPFIGRRSEIQSLATLALRERLVTATGPGGVGKTRLAEEVVEKISGSFPAGVERVDLAGVTGESVLRSLLAAFDLSEATPVAAEEVLRRRLGTDAGLLVLDSCEHVAVNLASVLSRLVNTCSTLHVLCTSRVPLGITGEVSWTVPALEVPPRGGVPGTDLTLELLRFDAVALFDDRARRVQPEFAMHPDNAATVAEICRRLEGVPLAIELAASRCRMLNPSEILRGLDQALVILAGSNRARLERHRSIEASITWSYELLDEGAQRLLRRLAVFEGGAAFNAIVSICADEHSDRAHTLDTLAQLIDHSLVTATDRGTGTRFSMLDTVRQFAFARLSKDVEEATQCRLRHSEHYSDWMLSLGPPMGGADLLELMPALEAERENLAATLQHLVDMGRHAKAAEMLRWVFFLPTSTGWSDALALCAKRVCGSGEQIDARTRASAGLSGALIRFLRGHVFDAIHEFGAVGEQARAKGVVDVAAQAELMTCGLGGGMAGMDVLDRILAAAPDVADDPAPFWRGFPWVLAEFIAANQGKLRRASDLRSKATTAVRFSPLLRTFHLEAVGILDIWEVRPRSAIEVLRTLVLAGSKPGPQPMDTTVTRLHAPGYLAMAAGDIADFDEIHRAEDALRTSAEIEENPMAVFNLAGVRCLSALLADDLPLAERYLRAGISGFQSAGLFPLWWFHEQYVLTAAGTQGVAIEDVPPTLELVCAAARRCRAELALQRGATDRALDLAHDTLDDELAIGAPRALLFTLEAIARIFVARDRFEEAARLIAATRAFRAQRDLHHVPCLRRLVEDAADQCARALGESSYSQLSIEGRDLDLDTAARYANRLRSPKSTASFGWEALTPAEKRVADLVARGRSNPDIATELAISRETVKTHLSRVFSKLGVANRREVILEASRRDSAARRSSS